MRRWTQLCSDVNWEDYHGMWARKARDGSWYVLRWTNLWDAAGESEDLARYECSVKRLDLRELPPKERASALQSCGLRETPEGLVDDRGDVIDERYAELAVVECCIFHGLGAPLEDFCGDHYPLRIRAQARRYAEQCMRDADLLEERLDRPVNAIGTSAANYGNGIIFTCDREG